MGTSMQESRIAGRSKIEEKIAKRPSASLMFGEIESVAGRTSIQQWRMAGRLKIEFLGRCGASKYRKKLPNALRAANASTKAGFEA
jgi:hypothetical protein